MKRKVAALCHHLLHKPYARARGHHGYTRVVGVSKIAVEHWGDCAIGHQNMLMCSHGRSWANAVAGTPLPLLLPLLLLLVGILLERPGDLPFVPLPQTALARASSGA